MAFQDSPMSEESSHLLSPISSPSSLTSTLFTAPEIPQRPIHAHSPDGDGAPVRIQKSLAQVLAEHGFDRYGEYAEGWTCVRSPATPSFEFPAPMVQGDNDGGDERRGAGTTYETRRTTTKTVTIRTRHSRGVPYVELAHHGSHNVDLDDSLSTPNAVRTPFPSRPETPHPVTPSRPAAHAPVTPMPARAPPPVPRDTHPFARTATPGHPAPTSVRAAPRGTYAQQPVALGLMPLQITTTFKVPHPSEISPFPAPKGMWYVITRGEEVGIFPTWTACCNRTQRVTNAIYEKFYTFADAHDAYSAAHAELALQPIPTRGGKYYQVDPRRVEQYNGGNDGMDALCARVAGL